MPFELFGSGLSNIARKKFSDRFFARAKFIRASTNYRNVVAFINDGRVFS